MRRDRRVDLPVEQRLDLPQERSVGIAVRRTGRVILAKRIRGFVEHIADSRGNGGLQRCPIRVGGFPYPDRFVANLGPQQALQREQRARERRRICRLEPPPDRPGWTGASRMKAIASGSPADA